MKFARIPKRNGTWRIICVPEPELKARLRARLGALEDKARKACPPSVCHGFTRRRSPVTNALAHVGHAYTITMDLKDFFDSITPAMLSKKLPRDEVRECLIDPGDGRGPRPLQGLPTSPAVANLAAADMDRAILRAVERAKLQIVYTRYADDLALSYDDPTATAWIMREIPMIARRCGFRIAPHKTRLMSAHAGRRIITGVAVGEHGIYPTREIKRRLRAARHQSAARKAAGLAEWAALKLPKERPNTPPPDAALVALRFQRQSEAERLAKYWRLGQLPRMPETPPELEVTDGDFIITRDPVYILGMSTYTTGWTSCMRQPEGQYRKGVLTWYALAGTYIAALLSRRTVTHGGVTRRAMQARALIHRFRNGQVAYDRRYGDLESIERLRQWLRSRGIEPVSRIASGTRVIGNVPRRLARPYCDSLHPKPMMFQGRKVWVLEK